MKVEIDTNKDSYEVWKLTQKLVENVYMRTKIVRPLEVKPGGKEEGTILLKRII